MIIENNFSEGIRMLNTEFGRSFLNRKLPPKVCHECRVSVSLPSKMASIVHLLAERFGIPFQAERPKLDKVQELINDELDDLKNGIKNMQLGKTPGDSYYAAAMLHFWNGFECPETENNNDEVKCITLTHRASLNAITTVYESLENAELSTLEEGRNQWDTSVMISCTKDHCRYAGMSWNFPWNEKNGKFYEKWMNPTHLLSVAYLSNLFFMTGNYVECSEVVREKHGLVSDAFYSELFPMIFCPELASLFDENLQEVLGFLWLCKHLLGGERIFEFSTCPHLFMLYIRIQSLIRLGDNTLEVCKPVFNTHRVNCKYRFYLYPYHYVLFDTAWRNSERRKKME